MTATVAAEAGEEAAQRAATREAPSARGPISTDAKAALLTGGLILSARARRLDPVVVVPAARGRGDLT